MGRTLTMTAAAVALTATSVSSAYAEDRRAAFDWGTFLVQADAFARGASEKPNTPAPTPAAQADRAPQPFEGNGGNAWFGVAPRVTLVARDWGSAYRLAGDRLSLADTLKLSSSTRMILSRARLSDTRVTPFVQLGLGQWRTDPNLLPLMPRNTELAAQFGGGVEIHVTRNWELCAESALTAIYREQREPQNLPTTKLWSAMIASRVEF